MTDIYLYFPFAHYELYGNAPVATPFSVRQCSVAAAASMQWGRANEGARARVRTGPWRVFCLLLDSGGGARAAISARASQGHRAEPTE